MVSTVITRASADSALQTIQQQQQIQQSAQNFTSMVDIFAIIQRQQIHQQQQNCLRTLLSAALKTAEPPGKHELPRILDRNTEFISKINSKLPSTCRLLKWEGKCSETRLLSYPHNLGTSFYGRRRR